jgi:leucyl-tRNA synthetase
MRFLQRLWRNVVDESTGELTVSDDAPDLPTLKLLNNTIAAVSKEMEAMRPNTSIAKLIVLNNHLTSLASVPRAAVEPLILMLAPIAPHICEELWSRLGHTESLAHEPWPKADERYVGQDTVTAVVQIKGKVRAKLEVSPDIDPAELEAKALAAIRIALGRQEAAQGDRQGPEDRFGGACGVETCFLTRCRGGSETAMPAEPLRAVSVSAGRAERLCQQVLRSGLPIVALARISFLGLTGPRQ